jgi:hypothetical protein
MESGNQPAALPAVASESKAVAQERGRQRLILIGIIVGILIILALIILAIWFLLQPSSPTDRIRDIFIIFMALESLLLGLALVILIIQLARLINLLQNEIKPILDSTNETVSTLRGTSAFLSDNLVGPVIKMNEYLAGMQQALRVFGLARRGKRRKSSSEGD